MSDLVFPLPTFQPTEQHLEILREFDKSIIHNQSSKRFFYLNWHRRARKSTLGVNLLIKEAVRNPNSRYLYVAPTYKQGKTIIWRDPNMLRKYLPPESSGMVTRMHETDLYIEFNNGSSITIVGGDDPDSARGIDCEGVVLDEYSLIKPEVWDEILSPIIRQKKSRWAVFIFTPKGKNHAYTTWNKCVNWDDWYRSLLRADTSGLIPPDELEKAREEARIQSLFHQEFLCEFIDDDDKVLITYSDIEKLNKQVWTGNEDIRKIISIDPSGGGDECTFKILQGYEIIGSKTLRNERNTMNIVHEACMLSVKYQCDDMVVDSIGIGAGVADRLEQIGKRVIKLQTQERKSLRNPDKFYNLRAEIWWHAMELITTYKLPPILDEEVKNQITSLHYDIDVSGRIKLEKKKDFKTRIGRSPDDGDAYVNGIYCIEKVRRWYYDPRENWRRENPLKYRKKPTYHGTKNGW